MAELYGYAQAEELYGKNMQELMSADSHKAFREKMPQLQNLNPSEGEIQISRPDGSVVDVWRKGIPLTGADGNFSGILSYDRDISKRKKAELKLRESEERFSSSFESSNIGMTMTGLDGRFLLVNKALSKMLGYTRAELKAKRLRDITHSEDAQKSLVYLRILLRNEINSFEDKKRYIRKDGSIFWVEIRVSAVRDEEGNLQYFFRHILDISERKRAEEKLRASEERQRTLLEATSSAGIFLFVVDDSYNVRYMNTPMIEAFGDLVGKTCHSAVNGGKSPCDYCQLSKVLQEGEQVHYQPTIADGRVFDIIALPYTDIEGTLCKLEIIQDITERVQSETELKKLYQAVEQSANSVVITDLDGSIEYVNPKFLKLTGYTEDEILGENPRVLKSGEHSKAFHKNLWETITSGEEWHGEFCNKKKDGSLYWESASIAPVLDAKGKAVNFIAVKEDITQQMYIERELQKSYRELETKVKERTKELSESEARYRAIIQDQTEFINRFLPDGTVTFVNQALDQYKKKTQKFDTFVGKNLFDFFSEKDKKDFQLWMENATLENPIYTRLHIGHLSDGSENWERWTNRAIFNDNGELTEIQAVGSDVTKEVEAERLLKESEARYRLLAENTSDFVWIADIEKLSLSYASPSVKEMFGYTPEEFISRSLEERLTPEFVIKVQQILEEELAANIKGKDPERTRVIEAGMYHKEGHIIWIETTARFIYNEKGEPKGLMGAARDITERRETEEKLRQQATTDPPTEIFNRRYFFEVAQQELERSQRYKRPLSIIIFDIDHFKKINDTYGHNAGDEVLRKLTEGCAESLRENDIFARYGGEEFVILLPETDSDRAEQMAERMRKSCAETPLDVGVATVNQTVSFGVANLNGEKIDLDELLLRADKALYQAKEAGRNRVCLWEKS